MSPISNAGLVVEGAGSDEPKNLLGSGESVLAGTGLEVAFRLVEDRPGPLVNRLRVNQEVVEIGLCDGVLLHGDMHVRQFPPDIWRRLFGVRRIAAQDQIRFRDGIIFGFIEGTAQVTEHRLQDRMLAVACAEGSGFLKKPFQILKMVECEDDANRGVLPEGLGVERARFPERFEGFRTSSDQSSRRQSNKTLPL